MNKLSFRARTLDAGKPMPVYIDGEIPELFDFASVNRAVVEMPTGMEKEEETEHHLQKVLSAHLHCDEEDGIVIPIPDMNMIEERFNRFYTRGVYKPPKQYIHVQPFGIEQDIPEYDMDSDDEIWLTQQVKHLKMDVTPTKFESMMDRLEKASGQVVVSLPDAKSLLRVDDELIIAVYDYWLNKRLKEQRGLIPQVKMEKRDGSSGNNPYVAFRRRTEKMQTRKNRKNDEASYEKMLKLKKDLKRVLILLEMVKRREKSKKEQLKLATEVIEKRYQMEDWDGKLLDEANARKDLLPKFVPLPQLINLANDWGMSSKDLTAYARKKRDYRKRKHRLLAQDSKPFQPAPTRPTYSNHSFPRDVISTDDDGTFSPPSPRDDVENEPDGVYTFRRREGCSYHAARSRRSVGWPWCSRPDGDSFNHKYQYSLTSISHPYCQCIGFARRRLGRGGRVLFDRGVSQWDDELMQLNLSSSASKEQQSLEYVSYIRTNGIQHYRSIITRPHSYGDPGFYCGIGNSSVAIGKAATTFSIESFQCHQEKLIAMQQQQLRQQQMDSDASNRSDATAVAAAASLHGTEAKLLRFTLDSERAKFAASAVRDVGRISKGLETAGVGLFRPPGAASSSNGLSSVKSLLLSSLPCPSSSTDRIMRPAGLHQDQLSTSPAASILQLNYPINRTTSLSVCPPLRPPTPSSAPLQGSSLRLPFYAPQTSKHSVDCVITSRAVTPARNSSSARRAAAPVSCLATAGVPYASSIPPAPRIMMSVPVRMRSSSQAIIKLGSASGRTDLLTRENRDIIISSAVKDKVFPMEVT